MKDELDSAVLAAIAEGVRRAAADGLRAVAASCRQQGELLRLFADASDRRADAVLAGELDESAAVRMTLVADDTAAAVDADAVQRRDWRRLLEAAANVEEPWQGRIDALCEEAAVDDRDFTMGVLKMLYDTGLVERYEHDGRPAFRATERGRERLKEEASGGG